MAVPLLSPGDQPLFGVNQNLSGLYSTKEPCPVFDYNNVEQFQTFPLICFQAVRNNPALGSPALVAWPTTIRQVQVLIAFANRHNLCVSVAGTGHDFLNRHSCGDAPGLFIRMSLFKSTTFDLADPRGPAGTVKLGAGHTFSEAQAAASNVSRFISSGWATTVGVVGWSLAGGHGPFAPSVGLGADNIVEVELVNSVGRVLVASRTKNPDLWWALRGGGGSSWGIITALTVRLHPNPPGGFTVFSFSLGGSFQDASLASTLDAYLNWTASLPKEFGGFLFLSPHFPDTVSSIPYWSAGATYVYLGPAFDELFNTTVFSLMESLPPDLPFNPPPSVDTYERWYDYVVNKDLETIIPSPYFADLSPNVTAGGLPSVLLDRAVSGPGGPASQLIVQGLTACVNGESKCLRVELYNDLTGQVGSPQAANVSIPPAFRTANLHLLAGAPAAGTFQTYSQPEVEESIYLLGDHSYFSESAWNMDNWTFRYWGNNYAKLASIQKKYDPRGRFGSCRHCVGDDQ